uniref:Transmembrane protein n=1 Tax=Panagrellus redivivus TaxID=6233 RepID=A0A7E4W4T5_PANRE
MTTASCIFGRLVLLFMLTVSVASRYSRTNPVCTVMVHSEATDETRRYEIVDSKRSYDCSDRFSILQFPVDMHSAPPRLLTVFKPNSSIGLIVYNTVPLAAPYAEESGFFSLMLNSHRFTFFNGDGARSINILTGVVYDRINTLLYVFHNDGPHDYVDVYMLESQDALRDPLNTFLFRLKVDSIFYGVQWSFDAYTYKVLYHKLDVDMETDRTTSNVYSIPFNSLLRQLKQGTPGQLESEFEYSSSRAVIHKVKNNGNDDLLSSAVGISVLVFVVLVVSVVSIKLYRIFKHKSVTVEANV